MLFQRNFLRSFLERIILIILLSGFFLILRLPTKYYVIPFYDDGETLYHLLTVIKGKSLYKDDYTHHFLGYILPFYWLYLFRDLGTHLIEEMRLINQVIAAWGIYEVSRNFLQKRYAVLAALIYISAREPWVLGFFQQYQINLFIIWSWVFIVKADKEQNSKISTYYLLVSSFLSGFAFFIDQRAIFGAVLPLYFLILNKQNNKIWVLSALSYLIMPLYGAYYIWKHNAVYYWYFQTFIYPREYRIGSASFADSISTTITLHKHLIKSTPFLILFSALGAIALLFKKIPYASKTFLLPIIFICVVPPLFGGRDYDYYTITWLVFLSFLCPFSIYLFSTNPPIKRLLCLALISCAPLISLIDAIRGRDISKEFKGDKTSEVVDYLKTNMRQEDTLYLWMYRLDFFVRADKYSAFPAANRIMIHPDEQITGETNRLKHIVKEYQDSFISEWNASRPTFLVIPQKTNDQLSSPAQEFVQKEIKDHYTLVKSVETLGMQNTKNTILIYRLKS